MNDSGLLSLAGAVAASWPSEESITAYATLAAVIVALGIGVGPTVRKWMRRPRLQLEVSRGEPHCLPSGSPGVDRVLIRVAVRNIGRSTSIGTWCEIGRWWHAEIEVNEPAGLPAPDLRWKLRVDDLSPLGWSYGERLHAEVPAGTRRFVELAEVNMRLFELEFMCSWHGEAGAHQALGRHAVELWFGADGLDATSQVIEFVIDARNFVASIRPSDAPTGYEDVRLLNLLDRVTLKPHAGEAP